jgi:hypothetical protein
MNPIAPDAPQASAPLPRARRRRHWAWHVLLSVVIFAGGAGAGASLSTMLRERKAEYYRQHPEKAPERFAQRLCERLDLPSAQAASVKEIVARQWPAIQRARAEMLPRFRVLMDGLRQDLVKVLTPAQLQKWDQYVADLSRSWQPATAPATTGP